MLLSDIKDPLVSVIIPVYNAEDYLPYCLKSVLSQSYNNLEVILVDDGSDDASPRICDDAAENDSRVLVIHQKNKGIAQAQNAGLDASHGEYIAFADNDDILDRKNIELLLDALQSTGASMSKARWEQYGVSQLQSVFSHSQIGSMAPKKITVFKYPLLAYQSTFCKSLRLIGDHLGKHSEARYCNEANWCRLYRKEVWDGVRFPAGVYAQDTAIAGELYMKISKVADLDVVLYSWLQRPESVTHQKKDAAFYHDHVTAASRNFALCLSQNITPARSYYTLTGNIINERRAVKTSTPMAKTIYENDVHQSKILLKHLAFSQYLYCAVLRTIRIIEKQIYDRKIKNMK